MKTYDNKSQHAPGPWTYIEDDAGYYLSSPSYGNFAVVHKSGRPDTVEMDAANAHLIAAAPELLQALKLCEGNVSSLCAARPYIYTPWLAEIRKAISEAEGRQ